MTRNSSTFCYKCNVRIPKNRPQLFCSNCDQSKHFRCQKLSKNDALHIIELNALWTCNECISDALPINACNTSARKNKQELRSFSLDLASAYNYPPKFNLNSLSRTWFNRSTRMYNLLILARGQQQLRARTPVMAGVHELRAFCFNYILFLLLSFVTSALYACLPFHDIAAFSA